VRFYDNFECENLTIRNPTCRSQKGYLDSVFWMGKNPERKLKYFKVENVLVASTDYVYRCTEFPVDGLVVEEINKGWFSEEKGNLGSAYGRYHYMAYGKILDAVRPKDNRYDGTLKTPAELAAE
jgi:hypothetical protein